MKDGTRNHTRLWPDSFPTRAVERFGFARAITQRLALHPRIRIECGRLDELPDRPVIVCTGPLTEGVIRAELGSDRMYFYDAIAPIVAAIRSTGTSRSARRGGVGIPMRP